MTDKMRSYVKGLILGLSGKPLPMSQKEPVAYLYNGVRLPALPEWDKTVYPYAYIWTLSPLYPDVPPTIYKLTVLKSPIRYGTVDGKLSMYIEAQASAMYNCLKTDGEFKAWEYYGETPITKTSTVTMVTWTNHDVISDTDGTVYYAASEPVPVYE